MSNMVIGQYIWPTEYFQFWSVDSNLWSCVEFGDDAAQSHSMQVPLPEVDSSDVEWLVLPHRWESSRGAQRGNPIRIKKIKPLFYSVCFYLISKYGVFS